MIVILAVLALLFGASFADAQPANAAQTDASQPTIPTLREEVVVTGSLSREPVSSLATTVQVIDEQTIERSSATTVTDLLAEMGVAFMGKWTPAQTSVNLRGGSNDPQGRDFRSQVVVLINGRRAGTSNLSKLSTQDVRRVEVLRGASSLLYGSQAIGGVINVILKDGLTSSGADVELTGGSFGLVNGSAGWGATFGRLDVRLTAQGARSGDYKSGADSVEVPVANTGWNQRGAGIAVGFTRSARERFSAQLRSDGMYDVGFRGSAWDTDNFENRDNQSFDAMYQRTSMNDRWTLALSSYVFRDTDDFHWGSEIVRNGNRPGPGFDTDDNKRVQDGRGLKGSITLQPGHGNTTWVGTDADWTVLRSTRVRTPVPGGATSQIAPFDNNNDTRNSGLFAETAQRLIGDRLVLRGGVRHDWAHLAMKPTPNFPTLAPRDETTTSATYRAGVVVQVVPRAHVRFGIGSGFRTPTATELAADFVAPQGGQQVGNPNLEPEKSRNTEVGVLADLGRASLDLVFFHTDINDRIALTAIDGNRSIWSNRGTSDISGLEVQTRADLFSAGESRVWTAVAGNYNFTMRDNEAQRLGLFSDRIQRMYQYQASWRLGVDQSRWTAQLLGALQGPMWYDTEESLLVPFAETTRTFVHRKNPFWLWNLSGDYDLGRGVRLRGAVSNLLNRNVHPTFIAENKAPYLSDPDFALGARGNSLPGRAFTVGLALRIP